MVVVHFDSNEAFINFKKALKIIVFCICSIRFYSTSLALLARTILQRLSQAVRHLISEDQLQSNGCKVEHPLNLRNFQLLINGRRCKGE